MENFKISLKAARVNKGLTQKQASCAVGINKSTLMKWEQGKTSPDGIKLIALCKLYGVSLNHIFLQSETTLSDISGGEPKGA